MLRSSVRRPLVATTSAFLLAVLFMSAPLVARAASASVSINDGSFGPAAVTIAVGDTVTWTNSDDSAHTVSAAEGAFDSGNVDPGATFSFTFTEAGTYDYVCRYHDEMRATIIVTAGSGPAPSPAAEEAGGAAQGTGAAAASTTEGDQPDTALRLPERVGGWMPGILVGLGLVAFAFAVFPTGQPRRASGRARSGGGWRR